jgi:hypothetical protein
MSRKTTKKAKRQHGTSASKKLLAGKSRRDVGRALRELRVLLEGTKDPAEARIAYGMECAIRWVTEDTVGWKRPAEDTKELAKYLRDELQANA